MPPSPNLERNLQGDAALNASILRIRELLREVPGAGMDLPSDLFQAVGLPVGPTALHQQLVGSRTAD